MNIQNTLCVGLLICAGCHSSDPADYPRVIRSEVMGCASLETHHKIVTLIATHNPASAQALINTCPSLPEGARVSMRRDNARQDGSSFERVDTLDYGRLWILDGNAR